MFIAFKIIHLLCLLLGGASSIGNAVLLKRVSAATTPVPPMVPDAMAALGKMGLGAVVLLWLTGVPMALMTGSFTAGHWAFWAKLIAATVLLVAVALMGLARARAQKAGTPPDLDRMKMLGTVARLATFLAIGLAVIAFN